MCQTSLSPKDELTSAQIYTVSAILRMTMPMYVTLVPPEAVNMSLGLSLTAATNPSQLLVSCPGSQEHPGGKSGDLGLLELGLLWKVEVLEWGGCDRGRGIPSH